ncbi:MAG: SDR family oxidoreductase [Arenicellales bacterium]
MANQTSLGSIIVTGASSGIGRATAACLLTEGYRVIGVSRSIEVRTFEHDNFQALSCDLANFTQTEQTFKQLLKTKPDIVGAVFCAGAGYFGALEQLKFSKIQALINLNLSSPILLSSLIAPYLKAKKSGCMVFIGSEAALSGTKNGTAYCATKFGLRGFTQALAAECRQAGVAVSLINPGMVDTPFFDELNFMPGEDASNRIAPETIATQVAHIFSSDINTVVEEINLSPRNKVVQFKT